MEQISEKFYEIVSGIVPLSLSEAEVDTFPYAVYEHFPTYVTDKTSRMPYKAVSELECVVYGKDFDELAILAERVISDVISGMNSNGFSASLSRTYKDCEQGIWAVQLDFRITQLL